MHSFSRSARTKKEKASMQKALDTTDGANASNPEVRYDRQLRLWGKHGQDCLSATRLCVLGSSSTPGECLKNLVLPGLGHFTLVDDAEVSPSDLGNNFYVDRESLGKSRAETVTRLLLEMNPLCSGEAKVANPVQLVEESLDYFADFTAVLAHALPEQALSKLAAFCWEKNIVFISTRALGFIGSVRVSLPEHTMVETHAPEYLDLRLSQPFPELLAYAKSVDIEQEGNPQAHGHVPWAVIVLQLWDRFAAANDGRAPTRAELTEAIKEHELKDPMCFPEDNHREALKNIFSVFSKYSIPSSVKAVLADPKAENPSADDDAFWFLAAALKRFVAKEGGGTFLPLIGTVPDMHGDTQGFIALQGVYKAKADADVAAIKAHLAQVLKSAGKPADLVHDEAIARFCKNSRYLRFMRYRSLEQELAEPNRAVLDELVEDLSFLPENRNLLWYAVLRAVDAFRTQHGRYPGVTDDTVEQDETDVATHLDAVAKQIGIDLAALTPDYGHYVKEAVRYGGAELHNISAYLGGVVAQEFVKLVTRQWVPLNNTHIFNGIDDSSKQFEA